MTEADADTFTQFTYNQLETILNMSKENANTIPLYHLTTDDAITITPNHLT